MMHRMRQVKQRSWIFRWIGVSLFSWLLMSCGKSRTEYVTTIVQTAADGLDLQAVTDLATRSKSAEDFEKKLNSPGNVVNNLDLNEDDVVDFIKVTEVHDTAARGFSLTTEVAEGDEQELCTIQFEEENGQANVNTQGNQSLYGNNHHYHYTSSLSNILLWSYLWNSHSPYSSRWGWNNYPGEYQRAKPRSYQQYNAAHKGKPYRTAIKKTSVSGAKQPMKSPNLNKTATKIKAPLKNPTRTQRAFQSRNPSKTLSRGGFDGAKSNKVGSSRGFGTQGSKSSSSRFGGWSSSRSGSGFGGGK